MTKVTSKSREASKRRNQDSLLGSLMIRLSGFRICQLIEKKSLNMSLVERKTLRKLFYSKEKKW
ncbi:MAG: hypothetical protein P9M02_02075 [Candidatus Susulua stagnicola]|nr:hypothetical protein [Candidatus Susulua stagnicola]